MADLPTGRALHTRAASGAQVASGVPAVSGIQAASVDLWLSTTDFPSAAIVFFDEALLLSEYRTPTGTRV